MFHNQSSTPPEASFGMGHIIKPNQPRPFLPNVKPTALQRQRAVHELKLRQLKNQASTENKKADLTIERVILGCNDNAQYLEFWEPVSRHWNKYHHIRPTLFFIGDRSKGETLDRTWGDVIIVDNLPDHVNTVFAAQVIRLLGPGLYPDDVCVTADMDLFLLSTHFFPKYTKFLPRDAYLQLNRYDSSVRHASMCYQIALGSTFLEIFGHKDTLDKITEQLKEWYSRLNTWSSDELIMKFYSEIFQNTKTGRFFRIHAPGLWGKNSSLTITRFNKVVYDETRLKRKEYIEYEPLRPYSDHIDFHNHILSQYFHDWVDA